MSDYVNEDRVVRLLNEKLDERDEKLENSFKELKNNDKGSDQTLQKQNLQLERIENKLANIYGNGTGRKCILDRLEEKTDATDKILKREIETQAAFRHEMRSILETQQLTAAASIATQREEKAEELAKKKDNKEWLKWLIGGIAIAIWSLFSEWFKIHVLKVK